MAEGNEAVVIARYGMSPIYGGLVSLVIGASVLWFGLTGTAGFGRNTLALVVGSVLLVMALTVVPQMIWRRRALVVGRRGELVIYRYGPWGRSRRLVGDLSDVELVGPTGPFPDQISFGTELKRSFGSVKIEPPNHTTVRLLFQGSAGSIEVDAQIELIDHNFAELFEAWKLMQG